MKTCYVLGAGFGKDAAGLPLLSELSEAVANEIRRRATIPDQEIAHLILRRTPPSVMNNVEHLLTFFSDAHPWLSVRESSENHAAYLLISDIVQQAFNELEARKHPVHNRLCNTLIRRWHEERADVITFNYDTVVERRAIGLFKKEITIKPKSGRLKEITFRLGADHYNPPANGAYLQEIPREWTSSDAKSHFKNRDNLRPFFDEISAAFDSIFDELKDPLRIEDILQVPIRNIRTRVKSLLGSHGQQSFRYYKLHGSINWLYEGEGKFSNLFYLPLDPKNDQEEEIKRLARDLTPLIIPPLLDKSRFLDNLHIGAQWQAAREAIIGADELVVIGYSIPPTDLSASLLFSECFHSNRDLKVKVFTRGTADAAVDVERKWLGYLEGNKDRLRVINAVNSSIFAVVNGDDGR